MTQVENVPVEFVDLLSHPDYEILNVYPFTIRRKDIHHELKEWLRKGYPSVALNGKTYYKHRLIALQFLQNPNNYTEIDHINKTEQIIIYLILDGYLHLAINEIKLHIMVLLLDT